MSVRIRLTRTGRKNLPQYRIAVFDRHTRRDGPALEILGWYNPLTKEAGKAFSLDAERLKAWVGQGAQVTLPVGQLLKRNRIAWARPAKARPERNRRAKKAAAGKNPAGKAVPPKAKA